MNYKKFESAMDLYQCLKYFDDCFVPRLSERIIDLKQYSQKLYTYAEAFEIVGNNQKIGFIVFYCNDMVTYTGYLTLIAVNKEYSHMGIGTELIKKYQNHCKRCGMNKLRLEVYKNNRIAISFYEKIGFSITDENDKSYYMEKKIMNGE